MPIVIDNVRLGYATNSSSSHSLIFAVRPFDESFDAYDTTRYTIRDLQESRELDYGWDWFEFYQPIGKLLYLYAQIAWLLNKRQRREFLSEYESLLESHGLSLEDLVDVVYGKWSGELKGGEITAAVDHQSQIHFPNRRVRSRSGKVKLRTDYEFLFRAAHYLIRSPYVAIWGGHDNMDRQSSYAEKKIHPYARYLCEAFTTIYSTQDCAVVKPVRSDGTAYTIFLPERDGLKVRYRFVEDAPFEGYVFGDHRVWSYGTECLHNSEQTHDWRLRAGAFDKRSGQLMLFRGERLVSDTPELIDLKITDYCPFGCSFCYQGSTADGKHADFGEIERFADLCFELGVFEVAIGGGEPTLHPRFLDVLSLFAERGILAHFTTKNLKFLSDAHTLIKVFGRSGSSAYSLDPASEREWSQLETALSCLASQLRDSFRGNSSVLSVFADRMVSLPHRIYIHLVMGTFTRDQYRAALERLYSMAQSFGLVIPITLLGFKRIGRGEGYEPIEYRDWWLEETMGFYNRDSFDLANNPSFRWHDQRSFRVPLGIDTALARESEGFLKAYGVPDVFYEVEEGRHNAYYDAVSGRLSLASYEPYLFRARVLNGSSLTARAFKQAYHSLQRREGYRQ